MITTPEEYQKYLGLVNNPNYPTNIIPLPENEPIYNINLDTRKVEAPKFVGVLNDHQAEILHFTVDRYFDNMDLYDTVCFIKYRNTSNKNDEGRVYYVPFMDKDYLKDDNKLIFPWCVSGYATSAPGTLEFSFQFYSVVHEEGTDQYYYSFILNTSSVTTQVLPGLDVNLELNENYLFTQSEVENIYAEIDKLRREEIYWIIEE